MLLFAILSAIGVSELGQTQIRINYLTSFICLFSFFWLRKSKESYKTVAVLTIFMVMGAFTSALFYVPHDELRIIWFLIAATISHLIIGRNFGFLIVALSIIIVIGSNYFFPSINYSTLALSTFVVTLVILSLILALYDTRINSSEAKLLQQNDELNNLVNRDALTKIMSRRYFLDVANQYFNTASRNKTPISLLMLDIDHFKKINDNYGHHIGDKMLILFAEKIEDLLRQSDIFGRIGGEEFGIILYETDIQGAHILSEKIRQEIEALRYPHEQKVIKMTTSIGVGEKIENDTTFEKLMIRSDSALYQAKKDGRNRISIAL